MDIESAFRMITFVVFLMIFSISSYYRKRARENGEVIKRREEGIIVLVLRLALALPFFVSLLIYIFYPGWLMWAQFPIPIWLRLFFIFLMIFCVPFIWWVFRSIGQNISETVLTKTYHELVTHGPYRWIRHPLYASTLLLLLSISIVANNWFLFAYWCLASIIFRYLVIPIEEKRLIEAFDEKYKDYQKRTGALIPKVF
jgi:protein-S-isoprenylcysteine O-methyltransferase Ste14